MTAQDDRNMTLTERVLFVIGIGALLALPLYAWGTVL